RNMALAYLLQTADADAVALAEHQFRGADNMTDAYAALNALVNCPGEPAQQRAQQALADYYQRWQHEPLVVNQWFQAQAWCVLPGGLERVEALLRHPAFDLKNPNKVRAVIGAFSAGNPVNFHRDDGASYRFLVDQVQALDGLNPQIASRLVTPLTRWRKYPPRLATLMRGELERLRAVPALSRDVSEIVGKSLA
ncbi:MAG: aminopeptidase N C-terminal domain-containing protein, partial [Porticoccaceae bacterium]